MDMLVRIITSKAKFLDACCIVTLDSVPIPKIGHFREKKIER